MRESAFAQYMRYCRGTRSLGEAARRSGVPRSAISRLEGGKRLVSVRTLKRLCESYGVGVEHAIDLMSKARAQREKEQVKDGQLSDGR